MPLRDLSLNNYDGSIWAVNRAKLVFYRSSARLVNIGYTPWSKFGECSAKCDGKKTRRRKCFSKALGRPNFTCDKALVQTVRCGARCGSLTESQVKPHQNTYSKYHSHVSTKFVFF